MYLKFHHHMFESEVRKQLSIFDRPISEEDAQTVKHLDLSGFQFLREDMAVLSAFSNLRSLNIEICHTTPEFWHTFTHMEELDVCVEEDFDFSNFKNMKQLSYLFVSGGDYSNVAYLNLDALIPLNKLRCLQLHECSCVDLLPLLSMPQLRELGVLYANEVRNIEIIGMLSQLENLCLIDLRIENLDFLDQLPDHVRIELCGLHVYNGVDPQKWKRFHEYDICEISVKDKFSHYIDLSVLDS